MFYLMLSSDKKVSHLVPTWQDTEVWKSINAALASLADFTDVMSGKGFIISLHFYHYSDQMLLMLYCIGEKCVTSSALIPVMDLLSRDVLQEKEADTQMSNNLRAAILSDLSKRNQYIWVVELLQIATFLDPPIQSQKSLC